MELDIIVNKGVTLKTVKYLLYLNTAGIKMRKKLGTVSKKRLASTQSKNISLGFPKCQSSGACLFRLRLWLYAPSVPVSVVYLSTSLPVTNKPTYT